MSESQSTLVEDIELVDAAQAARMLGTKPSRIKQLIRDSVLVGLYSMGSWWVPAKCMVPVDSEMGQMPGAQKMRERIAQSAKLAEDEEPLPEATHVPLWTLSGTVTVLKDDDFSDDEVLRWLFNPCEELGDTPIEAMLQGLHHRVNSVASTLGW